MFLKKLFLSILNPKKVLKLISENPEPEKAVYWMWIFSIGVIFFGLIFTYGKFKIAPVTMYPLYIFFSWILISLSILISAKLFKIDIAFSHVAEAISFVFAPLLVILPPVFPFLYLKGYEFAYSSLVMKCIFAIYGVWVILFIFFTIKEFAETNTIKSIAIFILSMAIIAMVYIPLYLFVLSKIPVW